MCKSVKGWKFSQKSVSWDSSDKNFATEISNLWIFDPTVFWPHLKKKKSFSGVKQIFDKKSEKKNLFDCWQFFFSRRCWTEANCDRWVFCPKLRRESSKRCRRSWSSFCRWSSRRCPGNRSGRRSQRRSHFLKVRTQPLLTVCWPLAIPCLQG